MQKISTFSVSYTHLDVYKRQGMLNATFTTRVFEPGGDASIYTPVSYTHLLNVKEGVIQEALVETIGCSGMTHSAAMAAEILPGKTILEALNTDLVCDAINTAMRLSLIHI